MNAQIGTCGALLFARRTDSRRSALWHPLRAKAQRLCRRRETAWLPEFRSRSAGRAQRGRCCYVMHDNGFRVLCSDAEGASLRIRAARQVYSTFRLPRLDTDPLPSRMKRRSRRATRALLNDHSLSHIIFASRAKRKAPFGVHVHLGDVAEPSIPSCRLYMLITHCRSVT